MEEPLCEVCGNDPCVCVDGFSIETEDLLDEDVAADADEVTEEDPLMAAALHNDFDDEDEEALLDDEIDDEIDLPFTDED